MVMLSPEHTPEPVSNSSARGDKSDQPAQNVDSKRDTTTSRIVGNGWDLVFKEGIPYDLQFPYENFSQMMEWLRAENAQTVLDVASGFGRHAKEMARDTENGPAMTVIAFDLATMALKRAKTFIAEGSHSQGVDVSKVHQYRGDMFESYPLQTASIDAAVAIQALYHGYREDLEKALLELSRVIKPGGLLIATFSKNKERAGLPRKGEDTGTTPQLLKVADKTFMPLSGREARMPHFYPDEDDLRELFGVNFVVESVIDDTKNDYYIVKARNKETRKESK